MRFQSNRHLTVFEFSIERQSIAICERTEVPIGRLFGRLSAPLCFIYFQLHEKGKGENISHRQLFRHSSSFFVICSRIYLILQPTHYQAKFDSVKCFCELPIAISIERRFHGVLACRFVRSSAFTDTTTRSLWKSIWNPSHSPLCPSFLNGIPYFGTHAALLVEWPLMPIAELPDASVSHPIHCLDNPKDFIPKESKRKGARGRMRG